MVILQQKPENLFIDERLELQSVPGVQVHFKKNAITDFCRFLDRLAHSSEAGEPFEQFIWTEQKVVMNEFDTMYKNHLVRSR